MAKRPKKRDGGCLNGWMDSTQVNECIGGWVDRQLWLVLDIQQNK
jgi:hypothetical protein